MFSRVYIKRAKSVQRTELHLINIVPQLTDLISTQIEKIISFHDMLHHSGVLADVGDRSDIRLFPGFREAIETANEFCAHRLRILLSLSVDGFVPKRLSRREIWPLYLRLENVSRDEGNNFHNSLLAGILCTPVKPSDLMMETLFSRLESELSALRDTPMEVNINGAVWTLEVSLYRGIADMAAQKILYGMPTWNRNYGCSKCDLVGVVQGRQRIWLPAQDEIPSLRTPESFARDAEMTPAMRIMLPCAFSSDSLHICSEGVTRDRLRDMFNAASRFPGLRVDYHNTELLKTCLRKLSSHTYSNSLILSLEDLKTCKAAEIDEVILNIH
ncbi:unnamed protein product [Cylicostephanus goldi]|uniref:Uncharacterized protein n=1 Tax=Cylicostephanus goldi TaxID=71465 RepID=A0A3P6R0T7_CYLGO|nr:unnamed protein product [Cylicostephanus goldi]